MKKTVREEVLSGLIRTGKKNKLLRVPMMICAGIFLFAVRVCDYISGNSKRFASVLAAFLFFAMSSSFSFPALASIEMTTVDLNYLAEGKTVPVESDISSEEQVEILDDSDVLDGYEDSELENLEDIDKFTLDEILKENGVKEAGAEEKAEAQVDLENVVFDKNDWRLVLINKQHPIPDDYTFSLGTIKGSMKCDERIIDDLLAMLRGAKKDGINLVICSPYRDLNRQEVLFNRKVKAYMQKDMSYMEAYKLSSQAVTVPGASEHQIGLALDIVSDTYSSLNEGFGDTQAGRWLAEHSCEYGFTLRYPSGKEYITSIEYEPWHFRYVGKEAATVMKERNLCLEEFVEGL